MKKKHLLEIQRINKSIPKELLDKLTTQQYKFPTLREIAMKAIANPLEVAHIVSPAQLRKYKEMLDSGYLDQKEEVINHDVEKEIDAFLDVEFEKARKLGRLPPPQKMPKLKNKSKQNYVRENKEVVCDKENNG